MKTTQPEKIKIWSDEIRTWPNDAIATLLTLHRVWLVIHLTTAQYKTRYSIPRRDFHFMHLERFASFHDVREVHSPISWKAGREREGDGEGRGSGEKEKMGPCSHSVNGHWLIHNWCKTYHGQYFLPLSRVSRISHTKYKWDQKQKSANTITYFIDILQPYRYTDVIQESMYIPARYYPTYPPPPPPPSAQQ